MIDDDIDLASLPAEQLEELDALIKAAGVVWQPLPGPQTMALESKADVLGYGGAAGGGKTDLICGASITDHERILILRREKNQTDGIVQRLGEILGSTDGYSSQKASWRVPAGKGGLIELGGLDDIGDERKWQGRPHDLINLDEATEMREMQARFVLGWNRTNNPTQRVRAILTFNPPTTPEGRWVIKFFAPWLDKKHPNPARPGELRWFTTVEGVDMEVPDSRPFVMVDKQATYSFDAAKFKPEEILQPKSRTFIPALVTDNPYYMATGYISTLQSLPEPLRSQMLFGDFHAGTEDDQYQVIPTKWVEAAMKRWKRPDKLAPMDSMGVDVAMRGSDNTVIARRHGVWFDTPIVHKGIDCTDGPTIAGFIIAAKRDDAVIHIDLFGVGAQPFGHLMGLQQQVVGVNVGEPAPGADKASGRLPFFNLRSMLWWRMREALDPAANTGISLPDDQRLLADLCAPKWSIRGQRIMVQGRDEIVAKIGRSPDFASAYVLALMDTPKAKLSRAALRGRGGEPVDYDPYRGL
jgi:hypothetical protein